MPVENVNEIKEYLEANKDNEEVKALFTGFVPKDKLDEFIESEDGKKLLQPRLDKYFTKGLDTWKANNLSKIIDEEVAKRNPAETPEQKMIREMQEKLNNMEKQTQSEKLKNGAAKKLSEKGLPVGLADFFNADSEEGFNAIVDVLDIEFKKALEAAVTERLKGKTPPSSEKKDDGKTPTKLELAKMPMKERLEFYNKNPELFNKIMQS